MKKKISSRIYLIVSFLLLILISTTIQASSINIDDLKEVSIDNQDELIMKIGGAEIYFDDSHDNIFISEELKVYKSHRNIEIVAPERGFFSWFRRRNKEDYKIVIGSARQYNLLEINAGGLSLEGVIRAKNLNINAAGIAFYGEVYSDTINFNGAGISIKSIIDAKNFAVNGAGIDLKADIIGVEDMTLNGVGIDVRVKYLDKWSNTRQITLNGVGGDLKVEIPDNRDRTIDELISINTSGIINSSLGFY